MKLNWIFSQSIGFCYSDTNGLKERLQPLSSQTFLSTTQIKVWWLPRDPILKQNMKKILIVRMIFGSKLLQSWFALSHLRVSRIYTLFSSIYATERQAVVTRDAGTGVHDGGNAPCPKKGEQLGNKCPYIIGNFRNAGEWWNDGLLPLPF